jgi:hypothetical protein
MGEEHMTNSILLAAANWLETHNWCQRDTWQDRRGVNTTDTTKIASACAVGAIILATESHDIVWDALNRLKNHLRTSSIGHWNDATGRTKEEVIQALREAAK